MSNEQKEREAFEAWVSASGRAHLLALDEPHGWYKDLMVTAWWTAWLARAAHEAAKPGWQPIETAPKDESVILLGYTPNPRIERRVYEGRWHDAQQTWTSVNGFILHTGATHWMQLPTAPA